MLELGYLDSIDKTVKISDEAVRGILQEYIESATEENAKQATVFFDVLKKNYNAYMSHYESIKNKLKNGEELSIQDKLPFENIGNSFLQNVNFIIEDNKEIAKNLNVQSQEIYQSNKINLFIVIIAALSLLLTFSLSIVTIIRNSLKEVMSIYKRIASGDFTVEIGTTEKSEFGLLKKALSETIDKISDIIVAVKENSENISDNSNTLSDISNQMAEASQEVAASIQDVAKGSGSQTEELDTINQIINLFGKELERVIFSVEEIHNSTKNTDVMMTDGNQWLQELSSSTGNINAYFHEVSDKVKLLNDNIKEIGEITELINQVSDQTNLLSLNAAIEAARAGDAGRGFGVVADEIRKLAEQSKASANKINNLLSNVTNDSNAVTKTVQIGIINMESQGETVSRTIDTFKEIIADMGKIIPRIEEVNKSINQLNENKKQIVEKVESAADISKDNSAAAQQIAASSQEMTASVEEVASMASILNKMSLDMKETMNTIMVPGSAHSHIIR